MTAFAATRGGPAESVHKRRDFFSFKGSVCAGALRTMMVLLLYIVVLLYTPPHGITRVTRVTAGRRVSPALARGVP